MNNIIKKEIIIKRTINLFENDELYCDFETGSYDKNMNPIMFEKGAVFIIDKRITETEIIYKIIIEGKHNKELANKIENKIKGYATDC